MDSSARQRLEQVINEMAVEWREYATPEELQALKDAALSEDHVTMWTIFFRFCDRRLRKVGA